MIEFLFELLNAAIVFGALGYAAITYGIPWLNESTQKEEKQRADLKMVLTKTVQEQDRLVEQIELQELSQEQLEHELKLWRDHATYMDAERQAHAAAEQARVQRHVVATLQQIQKHEIEQFIMPHVLARAEHLLIEKYQDPVVARSFVQQIVAQCTQELDATEQRSNEQRSQEQRSKGRK